MNKKFQKLTLTLGVITVAIFAQTTLSLAVELSDETIQVSFTTDTTNNEQQSGSWEGTLKAIRGSENIYYALATNERGFKIIYDQEIPAEYIEKTIRVSGILSGNTIHAVSIILVGPGAPQFQTTMSGVQRTAVLALRYSDIAQEPKTTSQLQTMIFGAYPSLKTHWEENSYNNLTLNNIGINGWWSLPNTQSYYNQPAGFQWYENVNDAIQVAQNNGVQFQDYDRLILFFNGKVENAAGLGLSYFSYSAPYMPSGKLILSVSWMAWPSGFAVSPNGQEYGHQLGFSHSGNVYSIYDSPWDVMSYVWGCTNQGQHTIVNNKAFVAGANWLTGSDATTTANTGFLDVTVYPTTKTTGLRAVKITTPDPNIYYTVEVRKQELHDSCLPNSGVIIHKVDKSLTDWQAKPIDATPGDNNLHNAQWSVGKIYSDTTYGFSIHVISDQPNSGKLIRITPTNYVSGSITQNTTWTSGTVYVIQSSVTVNAGVTLTIEPGAIVKFNPGTSITVNGALNAQGTASDKIYFTSIKDDSVGGDTNGDGTATSPAPGDFGGFIFSSGSRGAFSDMVMRYGGASPVFSVINITGGRVALTKTQLTNNSNGVYVDYGGTDSLTIDSSIISNNGRGITIFNLSTTTSIIINNNTFSNNLSDAIYAAIVPSINLALTLVNNKFSDNAAAAYLQGSINFINSGNISGGGIWPQSLYLSGTSQTDQVWNPGLPIIINSDFTIPIGRTLTIKSGVSATSYNFTNLNVYGNLSMQGDSVNKIYITNGVASGIVFYSGSRGTIINAVLKYGGLDPFYCSISAVGCGAITNWGGNVTIIGTRITYAQHGIYQTWGNTSLISSSIYNNLFYGVYNSSSNFIQSQNNWWGSASGPYHATLNPSGQGNQVSNNVNFIPWLSYDPTIVPIGEDCTATDC